MDRVQEPVNSPPVIQALVTEQIKAMLADPLRAFDDLLRLAWKVLFDLVQEDRDIRRLKKKVALTNRKAALLRRLRSPRA